MSSNRLDRLVQRPRPQAALARLGRWLSPHIPPRHGITIMNATLQGDPGMTAPIIQINEPAPSRPAGPGAGLEINGTQP